MSLLLVDEYLNWVKNYTNEFGKKTIVLCQTGGFYEVYAWNKDDYHINVVKNILFLTITSKKTKKGIHFMAGFPIHSAARFENRLLSQNFRVVYIDQVSKDPVTREKVRIVSPGTISNSDDDDKDSILASILIVLENNEYYYYVSIFESHTGTVSILPIVQEKNNSLEKIHQTIKNIINKYNVAEIIRNTISNNSEMRLPNFNDNISVQDKHYTPNIASKEFNDKDYYQPDILKKYFSNYNNVFQSIFENLDLNYADSSEIGNMILMLQFIEKHELILIKNLKKPKYCAELDMNSLTTFNGVYNKFQIFSDTDKGNCLFNILNKTLTNPGKRKLKSILYSPSSDKKVLTERYNSIDFFKSDKNLLELIKNNLKIIDLNRLYRRFAIGRIDAFSDIPNIVAINNKIENIISYFYNNKIQFNWIPNIKIFEQFKEYTDEILSIFCIENCKESLKNMSESKNVFNLNISKELEILFSEKQKCFDNLTHIRKELASFISEDIKLDYNEKDGHFLSTTKKRAKKLQKYNENKPNKEDLLTFISTNTNVKVFSENIKDNSNKIKICYTAIEESIKELTEKYIAELYKKYYDTCIDEIVNSITMIDVLYSFTMVAMDNNYIRPVLLDDVNSKLKAKQLRHPIIENILFYEKKTYIPNDIELSSDSNYILYGINSVGKSSLLKSIGISVIMAQCGMFVPAENFEFAPYNKIIIRMGNADNIFESHSSFICEMKEAANIIDHADKNTLVIADEFCSSTEIESAHNIVITTLTWLSKKKSSYIFATHFDDLVENIKEIHGLKIAHLKVTTHTDENDWIFDRKLTEGILETKHYGTMVASKIIKNEEFLRLLSRNKKNKKDSKIKRSNYNKALIVTKCQICGYYPKDDLHLPLHTHHIEEQCESNQNNYIDHFHKNTRANLVALCSKCHQAVHSEKLIIEGYTQKLQGNEELKWHWVEDS